MSVITRRDAKELLREVGARPDDSIDLAEAALALAVVEQHRPDLDLGPYRGHLAMLARDVGDAVGPGRDSLGCCVAALHDVIVGRYGYEGDTVTYDDLENASLLRVIDRRRGLPVTLGILYIHAARAQGWSIAGLNFPGHFLVRLEHRGERAILDPFNQGQVRSAVDLRDLVKATAGADAELEPSFYAEVGNRDILLRLENNIKLRWLRFERPDRAVETVETMILLAPGEPALRREAGLLYAHMGQIAAAVDRLESYLELAGHGPAAHQAAMLLQQLKSRLH